MSRRRKSWLRRSALLSASALCISVPILALAGASWAAGTTLISETFANSHVASPASWIEPSASAGYTNGACLTASVVTSQRPIPACSKRASDPLGKGALRLTGDGYLQEGGVMTTSSIPATKGIDATFNTYQYGGSGADGIAFVMAAENPRSPVAPKSIGQLGGDLGYSSGSISGAQGTGLSFGYLGVGFDVFGNFSNPRFDGTGCGPSPSWADTREPGQVVVRGPGNRSTGYCPLYSSLTGHPGTTQNLSSSLTVTRMASKVPVEIMFNTTGTSERMSREEFSVDVVPPGDFGVAWTPINGSPQFFASSLPTIANGGIPVGLYPPGWLNPETGIPYQIGFGWVASTGLDTDFHEVSDVVVKSLQPVPVLTANIAVMHAHSFARGERYDLTLTAGVATGVRESDPITMSSTLPAALQPGNATGSGWTCNTKGQFVSCVERGIIRGGTVLPPVTLPVMVSHDAPTSANALTTFVTVSSDDGDPANARELGISTLEAEPAIGLLIAGILGPLVLLYLLNGMTCRFRPFDQLRFVTRTVRISGDKNVVQVEFHEPPNTRDAVIFNRPSSLRNFECSGFDFKAQMPLSPFGAVTGRVSASAQRTLTNAGLWRDGEHGVVPLGLGKMWALRIFPEDLRSALSGDGDLRAPAQATVLYVFNSEGAPAEQLEEMYEEARRRLPEVLAALVRKLPPAGSPEISSGSSKVESGEVPWRSGEGLPDLSDGASPPLPDEEAEAVAGEVATLLSKGGSEPLPDLFSSSSVGLPSDPPMQVDFGQDESPDSRDAGGGSSESGSNVGEHKASPLPDF